MKIRRSQPPDFHTALHAVGACVRWEHTQIC